MSVNPSGKPAADPSSLLTPHEQQQESDRISDVFFLIDALFKREERTIKLVLDCLYDVGSINYINQKLKIQPFNQLLKWLARFPKPIFRIVALRWVKKNAPALVVRWLHRKVKFAPVVKAPAAIAAPTAAESGTQISATSTAPIAIPTPTAIAGALPEAATQLKPVAQPAAIAASASPPLPAASLVKLNDYQHEIRRLHSQVNMLMTLLVTVTVSLGGAFAWLMLKVDLTPAQSVQPIRPAIARCIDS